MANKKPFNVSALSLFIIILCLNIHFPYPHLPPTLLHWCWQNKKKLISFTRTRVLEYYVLEICGWAFGICACLHVCVSVCVCVHVIWSLSTTLGLFRDGLWIWAPRLSSLSTIMLHKDFLSIVCMDYADILNLLCCKKHPVLMSQEVSCSVVTHQLQDWWVSTW